MNTIIWIYIAVYSVFFCYIFLIDHFLTPAEEHDPNWETILDILLIGVGLLGMILYVRQVDTILIKRIWLVVVPLLLAGHGVLLVAHLRSRQKFIEPAEDALSSRQVLAIEVCTAVFLLPSLVLNALYVF